MSAGCGAARERNLSRRESRAPRGSECDCDKLSMSQRDSDSDSVTGFKKR